MTKEGRHAEEVMLKVPNGEDPYNVIGQYIQNHVTVIEDIIVTIEIDGVRTNELFMVDLQEDGYFAWKSDWYEGEQNVALINFFPVSDAEPERKRGKWIQRSDMPWYYYCSNCHRVISVTSVDQMEKFHAFCGTCGADMREEKSNEISNR